MENLRLIFYFFISTSNSFSLSQQKSMITNVCFLLCWDHLLMKNENWIFVLFLFLTVSRVVVDCSFVSSSVDSEILRRLEIVSTRLSKIFCSTSFRCCALCWGCLVGIYSIFVFSWWFISSNRLTFIRWKWDGISCLIMTLLSCWIWVFCFWLIIVVIDFMLPATTLVRECG